MSCVAEARELFHNTRCCETSPCGLDVPTLPAGLSLLPEKLVGDSVKFFGLRVCRDIDVGNADHVPVPVVVELGPESLDSRIVKVALNCRLFGSRRLERSRN